MFTLSLEPLHRVLRLRFTGLLTNDDLDRIDPALVRMAGAEQGVPGMRCLFDLTGIEALAVPQTRFAERAAKPAIGGMMRVVVAPPWAGEDFGGSYRSARSLWSHAQPIVVGTLDEAYRLFDVVAPRFEPAP
jgi:hypothetical protein